jgi:anti-sigma B factor antagonist
MKVVCETEGGRPVIRVRGEVDHASAPRLLQAAFGSVTSGGLPALIDLSECPYMDSGGVGVLLEVLKKVREQSWLGVIAPAPDLVRLFGIVGLLVDPAFRVYEDAATALSAAGPAGDGSR